MSKYHSHKTTVDGITFDSMKEAARYQQLKRMEQGGYISDLELQVRYRLIPTQKGGLRTERPCDYVADFRYTKDGQTVVEDTKGVKTPEYIIKRKLMKQVYGIEVVEI